jgi:predicted nucleic acid-binding protein
VIALDTAFLLDYLDGVDATRSFIEAYDQQPFFAPSLALFEVYRGAARAGGEEALDRAASALEWVEPLPLDDAAAREAASVEADLLDETGIRPPGIVTWARHRGLDRPPADLEGAIALARELEPYHPMFYEDPVPPQNFDAMAEVASKVRVPIATGESLHTVHKFEALLSRDAVQFVRPDVCMAGGLTGAKKIAGVAEARYANVVPHNPLSPVSTAACLQLAACIPNFAIQEYPYSQDGGEQGRELVEQPLERDGGYLRFPDRSGIGVELDDDAVADSPYEPRDVVTRLHEDGSVGDQ